MKKLFDAADAQDYSKLIWRVFMSYLGTPDCAELSLQDRFLVVNLERELHKYFNKKWRQEDLEEMKRKEEDKAEPVSFTPRKISTHLKVSEGVLDLFRFTIERSVDNGINWSTTASELIKSKKA